MSVHFLRKTRSRKIHDQELYPFLSIFINFINIYPFLSILSFLSIFIHFCPYLSILSISIVAPRVAPVQIYWIYKFYQLYLIFQIYSFLTPFLRNVDSSSPSSKQFLGPREQCSWSKITEKCWQSIIKGQLFI